LRGDDAGVVGLDEVVLPESYGEGFEKVSFESRITCRSSNALAQERRECLGRLEQPHALRRPDAADLGRSARSIPQRSELILQPSVALMARASAPFKTFSIGFRKDDFNEADYARIVARKFGTDHHEMILEQTWCRPSSI